VASLVVGGWPGGGADLPEGLARDLFLALRAHALHRRHGTAGAARGLRPRRLGHTKDFVGDPVGCLPQRVARRGDGELGLQQAPQAVVAEGPLELSRSTY
jgi:hypothetical protein